MPVYRAYQIDSAGHISHAPREFEAVDDVAAVTCAKQYIDGCDVELWRGEKLVTKLSGAPHPTEQIKRGDL